MNRRAFIYNSTATLAASNFLLVNDAFAKSKYQQITILHTNDVHSRIEAFPEGSKYAGMGGYAKRATLIKKIRATEPNVLLLDAGDLIQGTPYFNLFNGALEIKLMNELGYDATTIGNHDFDAGMKGLEKLIDEANFEFISSNYNFEKTNIKNKVATHKVIYKENIKIGVYAIGIALKGLVPDKNSENTIYKNPFETAIYTENYLKEKEACDLIICLSHLGFNYKNDQNKPSDVLLANKTKYTNLIIGGHTHTLLTHPQIFTNRVGNNVLVSQVGWGGTHVGLVKYYFNKNTKKLKAQPHIVIPI